MKKYQKRTMVLGMTGILLLTGCGGRDSALDGGTSSDGDRDNALDKTTAGDGFRGGRGCGQRCGSTV